MDEVVDDRQVGCVGGAERNVVDVGCGGNREVDRSTAGLTAALGGGGKAAPFPGDGSIDREWVEGRLDHTKALCPTRPLVGIAGEKSPEVQFRERGDADGSFHVAWIVSADQDGGIEQDAAHANGSLSAAGSRSRSSARVSGAGVWKTPFSAGLPTQRRLAAGPS